MREHESFKNLSLLLQKTVNFIVFNISKMVEPLKSEMRGRFRFSHLQFYYSCTFSSHRNFFLLLFCNSMFFQSLNLFIHIASFYHLLSGLLWFCFVRREIPISNEVLLLGKGLSSQRSRREGQGSCAKKVYLLKRKGNIEVSMIVQRREKMRHDDERRDLSKRESFLTLERI